MTKRQEILNNIMSNKDIVKVKWVWKYHVTYQGNWENKPITNNDRWRDGWFKRLKSGQITRIWSSVFGGGGVCHPVDDYGRGHDHGAKGVGQRLLIPSPQQWWPRVACGLLWRCVKRRHQMWWVRGSTKGLKSPNAAKNACCRCDGCWGGRGLGHMEM
jgi:hypothetical protein